MFYSVFKLDWRNRQEIIRLQSLCQLKGISLHFKHWNKNEVICKISSQKMLISIPIMVCCIWYDENSTSHVDLQLKKICTTIWVEHMDVRTHLQNGNNSREDEHERLNISFQVFAYPAEVIWHSKWPDFVWQRVWQDTASPLCRADTSDMGNAAKH